MSSGCMGSFGLTKAVYHFNETVTGNKIVNNLVFWGLAIVPVYSLAMAGDLLILNTIEFWTGNKLLGDASVPGGAERVVINESEDGSVSMTQGANVVEFVPAGDNRVVVMVDGVVVGSAVRQADGSVDQRGRRGGGCCRCRAARTADRRGSPRRCSDVTSAWCAVGRSSDRRSTRTAPDVGRCTWRSLHTTTDGCDMSHQRCARRRR